MSTLRSNPEGRAERIAALGYDYPAQEKEAVAECNLCGAPASEHEVVATVDRYGFPARYVECTRCGLGFLSPRMTAAAYGRFYGDVYRPLVSAFHGRRIDAETLPGEQRAYADDLVAWLRAELPAPPREILDIGGSTGIVAAAVRDGLGGHGVVLDPSADELAVAARLGLETVHGFAEDYDPGDRRFDLVLLCQTIDHLLDIASTLAAIRRVLAAGGRAFVDVLDVRIQTEKLGSIEQAVKIDHPFYLDDTTARAFFARAGLAVSGARLSHDGHRGYLLAPGAPQA